MTHYVDSVHYAAAQAWAKRVKELERELSVAVSEHGWSLERIGKLRTALDNIAGLVGDMPEDIELARVDMLAIACICTEALEEDDEAWGG